MGQVLCKACNPGTVSVNSGTSLSACQSGNQCVNCASQPCTPGTFQPSGGQSACVACSSTQYQDESGATACKPTIVCQPGSAESTAPTVISNRVCLPCLPGTVQSQSGQQACQPCPSGQYQVRFLAKAARAFTVLFFCRQLTRGQFSDTAGPGWPTGMQGLSSQCGSATTGPHLVHHCPARLLSLCRRLQRRALFLGLLLSGWRGSSPALRWPDAVSGPIQCH